MSGLHESALPDEWELVVGLELYGGGGSVGTLVRTWGSLRGGLLRGSIMVVRPRGSPHRSTDRDRS